MAEMGPFVMFGVVLGLLCIGLAFVAVEAYRQDLMASRRILLVILMFLAVGGLLALYVFYVLAPPSPAPESELMARPVVPEAR